MSELNRKPVFTLRLQGLGAQLKIPILAAVAFLVIVMLYGTKSAITVGYGIFALVLVGIPYAFGLYGRRIEFYEDKLVLVRRNRKKIFEIKYASISRIGEEHFPYRRGYSIYGNGDLLLGVIPSNPKKKALGDKKVVDWLKEKIASQTSRT